MRILQFSPPVDPQTVFYAVQRYLSLRETTIIVIHPEAIDLETYPGSYLETALKIVTYITIIIPLMALIIKKAIIEAKTKTDIEEFIKQIEPDLNQWVEANKTVKNAEIAREKILECIRNQNTTLDLAGLGLPSIPECVGKLRFLRSMDLRNNNLTTLPYYAIHTLRNISCIDLQGNSTFKPDYNLFIAQIPTTCTIKFSNVQMTLEKWNQLYQKVISDTSWIEHKNYLQVHKERIQDEVLACCTCLNDRLELIGYRLDRLPECIMQLQFPHLQTINLSGNDFHAFPISYSPEVKKEDKQLKSITLNNSFTCPVPSFEILDTLPHTCTITLNYLSLTVDQWRKKLEDREARILEWLQTQPDIDIEDQEKIYTRLLECNERYLDLSDCRHLSVMDFIRKEFPNLERTVLQV